MQTQTGQDYADAVAGLQVHVHHTNSGGDGLLVMRYWETLACGTVLLCLDLESVRRHFTPGVHLRTYTSPTTCKRTIRDLVIDPQSADIATQGRAHVLAHHTYRHRAQEILEAL